MRKKLELNPEERKIHFRKQAAEWAKRKREKRREQGYFEVVKAIFKYAEELGWENVEFVVGPEENFIRQIAEKLEQDDRFSIIIGKKIGVGVKDNTK